MLFGHQNDDAGQPTQTVQTPQDGVNPLAVDPATGASLPTAPPTGTPQPLDLDVPSALNQPSPLNSDNMPANAPIVEPTMPFPPAPEPEQQQPEPVSAPAVVVDPEPANEPTATFTPDDTEEETPSDDALLSLKQQALAQLSPLVDQLDQTPEEKFRTTMMLIQSTDNPSRIQDAYDAAQAITDEKVRAQALLDVINEINYFTQQKSAE